MILLGTFLVLSVATVSGQERISLPYFSFYDLEGNPFTNESIDHTLPTMVMLFDPYCDHCDLQADRIQAEAKQFTDKNIIFVTIEPEIEPIKDFANRHFAESGLQHLYFLQDKDFVFESYFGYTDDAVNIYLYRPGKKQPKYFGKEQEVAELLKHF